MSEADGKTCATCVYWEKSRTVLTKDGKRVEKDGELVFVNTPLTRETHGLCMRYPPTFRASAGEQAEPEWVRTQAARWCGEWRDKDA